MTSPDKKKSEGQKFLIRKMYIIDITWLIIPMVGAVIILESVGELDWIFILGTFCCLALAVYGFWSTYKIKKQHSLGENTKMKDE